MACSLCLVYSGREGYLQNTNKSGHKRAVWSRRQVAIMKKRMLSVLNPWWTIKTMFLKHKWLENLNVVSNIFPKHWRLRLLSVQERESRFRSEQFSREKSQEQNAVVFVEISKINFALWMTNLISLWLTQALMAMIDSTPATSTALLQR